MTQPVMGAARCESVFRETPLKACGFFALLLGPPRENALRELNNDLARAGSVRQVTWENMEELNALYGTDLRRRFGPELCEMYRMFLRVCMRDEAFTRERLADVRHLKSLFGISDLEHKDIWEDEVRRMQGPAL